MLRQIANASDSGFHVEVNALDGLLSKEEEISYFRIAQAAVNNILKHSNATKATIQSKYTGEEIQLPLADDGRGFQLEPAGQTDLKKSGFGLTGCAERVHRLGGKQNLQSTPGQRTTIQLMLNPKSHVRIN